MEFITASSSNNSVAVIFIYYVEGWGIGGESIQAKLEGTQHKLNSVVIEV